MKALRNSGPAVLLQARTRAGGASRQAVLAQSTAQHSVLQGQINHTTMT